LAWSLRFLRSKYVLCIAAFSDLKFAIAWYFISNILEFEPLIFHGWLKVYQGLVNGLFRVGLR
jgi:hypothetical protein